MPRSSPAPGLALAVLALLCVALPFARGGVDWPVQLAGALLAALAAALAAGSQRGATPGVALALGVVALAIALQLVPLPPALLRLLSPEAASLFDAQLRPLGLYPAARPLSLDPPATARELAKAVACLGALVASARLAASRSRQELLLGVLALSGTAVAALGLGAAVAGLAPLLEPRLTFVNPNHLAGFLNLGAFASLGFALRAHGRARLLWLMAFAVAGAGVFLSLSRGGISAFFAGAGVFGLLYVRRLRLDAQERSFVRYAAAPVAVATALAIAAYLALDPVLAEMRTVRTAASEAKIQMWPLGLAILRRFPLAGVGRGAFATVFPAWKVDPDPVTFTHLENEWLQAPIDLGLPVGLLLVGALAWTWLRAARARDLSRPEIGALAGTAALAAHNAVDFSFEVLGVAVPFAVALGLLARAQPAWNVRAWVLRWAAVGAAALSVGGMALWRAHPTETDAARIAAARAPGDVVALARSAARWHPADWLPRAAAGVRLVQEGRCADGLPWLVRAMALNPTAAEPHRYAARCLAAGGKDALARREYRLALLMGDPGALPEAMRRYPGLADLLEIVPDSPSSLVWLGSLLAGSRPEDAEQVLRRAWDEYRDLGALSGLASVALALGEAGEALSLARELEQLRPASPQGYLVASAALSRLGRADEAHRELELGASRVPGSAALLQPLASEALAAHRYTEAHRLAEAIAASTPGEVAGKRIFVARVLQAEGRMGEAIQEARSARDAVPDDPGAHLFVADLCAQVGRYDDAIAETEAAANVPGARPGAYADRLAALRAARQRQLEARTRQQILGAPLP